jgi:DNA-binding transcriptional LysR family regulator
MGIAVLSRMVLTTFPQAKYLSTHALPADLGHAPTVLIWRKGARSSKVSALLEILTDHAAAKSVVPRKKK